MKLLASTAMLSLGALGLAACGGDDALSYSAPVGIDLKAKSSDVAGGVVSNDKGITTESGNPYGAFVSDARDALGGGDPGRIEVEGLTLLLGAGSTGVLTLGEVFDGTVEVLFVMNDTNDTFPVGSTAVVATTPAGPIDLDVSFDSSAVAAVNWDKMLTGSFKVALRGPAQGDFENANADVDLEATFTFGAYP
ncbi:MAG: hypothetical protein H6708_21605 [Kofleriaceae bacterium]|nr:hypothetical protein [Kofleriaceae bacterium]